MPPRRAPSSNVRREELDHGACRHVPLAASEPLTAQELQAAITGKARELGLAGIAFTRVDRLEEDGARLSRWLAEGLQADLSYLAAPPDRAAPSLLLEGARTVMVVAMAHPAPAPAAASTDQGDTPFAPSGQVAAYAVGKDYHQVGWRLLRRLADSLAELTGRPVVGRPCVDTAPLLERALAARAGLDFVGKNGLIIVPGAGSYLLLGELLVDVELPTGEPQPSRCGACRACLDACPTRAFVAPFVLDTSRCISYLTIEHHGVIPRELRASMGLRIFGCDDCQTACPFNRGAARPAPQPELIQRDDPDAASLLRWLTVGSSGHRRLVRGTALLRVSRAVVARNAAVALGNLGDPRAIPHLDHTIRTHPYPLVRLHAVWARARLPSADRQELLREVARTDVDLGVRAEAEHELATLDDPPD